jgi:hypothetical protein
VLRSGLKGFICYEDAPIIVKIIARSASNITRTECAVECVPGAGREWSVSSVVSSPVWKASLIRSFNFRGWEPACGLVALCRLVQHGLELGWVVKTWNAGTTLGHRNMFRPSDLEV